MTQETATGQKVRLDIKRNRALQQASSIIHELFQGGYIADYCRAEAIRHLSDTFYRLDVEITTAEQRHVMEANDATST